MGLWYHVYPSAVETRFTHSLEVMMLAEKLLDTMGVRCHRVRKLVMVGALYHDVGHVALSHALDHCIEALTGLDHEHRSCQVVHEILHKEHGLLDEGESHIVQAIISGTVTKEAQKAMDEDEEAKWEPWMLQVVHHPDPNTPDVDRLAYIASNGIFCGLITMKPDFIISHAAKDTKTGNLMWRGCEEQIAMVQVVRAHMHRVCYQHPYVKRVEAAYLDAIRSTRLLEQEAAKRDHKCWWMVVDDAWLYTQLYLLAPTQLKQIETHTL